MNAQQLEYYRTLEQRLNLVISYFDGRLKDRKQLNQVIELIDHHGEYGEAYHGLCFLIAEEQIAIAPDVYNMIVELGMQMRMDDETWLRLALLQERTR